MFEIEIDTASSTLNNLNIKQLQIATAINNSNKLSFILMAFKKYVKSFLKKMNKKSKETTCSPA